MGLEPTTFAVTVRYSNQLNYQTNFDGFESGDYRTHQLHAHLLFILAYATQVSLPIIYTRIAQSELYSQVSIHY